MVFAADYPFLDVFWSMLIFFLFVAWLFVMVVLLTDVFRRHDISGPAKAAWTVFLIVLPFLGALTYLVQLGYVRATTNGGPSAEIEKAKELLDSGAITQMEFAAIKANVIA